MAIISEETISKLQSTDELINFIAAHRYDPENRDLLGASRFSSLPDHVQYVILIFDFETEYEMEGISTCLENEIGEYLPAIARAFDKTGNKAIANHINSILGVLDLAPGKMSDEGLKQYDIRNSNKGNHKELSNKIAAIDELLQPLILEKDFWDNVSKFLSYHPGN